MTEFNKEQFVTAFIEALKADDDSAQNQLVETLNGSDADKNEVLASVIEAAEKLIKEDEEAAKLISEAVGELKEIKALNDEMIKAVEELKESEEDKTEAKA